MKKWFFIFLNKIKKANPINAILLISGLGFVIVLSIIFGHNITSNNLVNANAKTQVEQYYLVEIDNFKSYNDAVLLSQEIMNKGGAGFIYYDEGFRVFLSAYKTRQEAENVCLKLNGYTPTIYVLNIEQFKTDKDFSDGINITLKNNVTSIKNVFDNLTSLISNYDLQKIGEIELKQNVLLLKEEMAEHCKKIMNIGYEDIKLKKFLLNVEEFVENINKIITSDVTNTDFSRLVHYQQIACLISYKKIVKLA